MIVSVGAGNTYGHPNQQLLSALERTGALVRRTDLEGDIAVAATGGGPELITRGSPRPAPR